MTGLFAGANSDEKWYYEPKEVNGAYQTELKKEDGSWGQLDLTDVTCRAGA